MMYRARDARAVLEHIMDFWDYKFAQSVIILCLHADDTKGSISFQPFTINVAHPIARQTFEH